MHNLPTPLYKKYSYQYLIIHITPLEIFWVLLVAALTRFRAARVVALQRFENGREVGNGFVLSAGKFKF